MSFAQSFPILDSAHWGIMDARQQQDALSFHSDQPQSPDGDTADNQWDSSDDAQSTSSFLTARCEKRADEDFDESFEEIWNQDTIEVVDDEWVTLHSHGTSGRNGRKGLDQLAVDACSLVKEAAAESYEVATRIASRTRKKGIAAARHPKTQRALQFAAEVGGSMVRHGYQMARGAIDDQLESLRRLVPPMEP